MTCIWPCKRNSIICESSVDIAFCPPTGHWAHFENAFTVRERQVLLIFQWFYSTRTLCSSGPSARFRTWRTVCHCSGPAVPSASCRTRRWSRACDVFPGRWRSCDGTDSCCWSFWVSRRHGFCFSCQVRGFRDFGWNGIADWNPTLPGIPPVAHSLTVWFARGFSWTDRSFRRFRQLFPTNQKPTEFILRRQQLDTEFNCFRAKSKTINWLIAEISKKEKSSRGSV